MNDLKTYLFLGVTTSTYAAMLNTNSGKRFNDDFTWLSVSFGTALILIFMRLLVPVSAWRKLLLSFVIGGSPMIVRSIYNKSLNS